MIDVQPLEMGREPLDRVQVVDGEHLGAGNPLEMLNDPATGAGGRTRDKDASHPVESREGRPAPASRVRSHQSPGAGRQSKGRIAAGGAWFAPTLCALHETELCRETEA